MIDSSIALGFRPPKFDNPLEALAQVSAIQHAQQQNRLSDLMYQEKQREVSDTAAMNSQYKDAILPDGTIDRKKLFLGVTQNNLGAKLPSIQKSFADLDKAAAELDKAKAETLHKQAEAAAKRLDLAGQAFGYVRQNPTRENAVAAFNWLTQNGAYSPQEAAQHVVNLPTDPAQIKALADQAFMTALNAKDQLMNISTRNTGGATETIGTNPVTGDAKVLSSVKNTQSPDNKATVAASMYGHKIAADRLEFDKSQPKGQVVQTDQGLVLVDPRAGSAQPVTMNGQPLQPKLRQLPAAVQKAIMENNASLRKVDQALVELGKYPDAFGAFNYLGDTIRQRTDPQGVVPRAFAADIGSLIIHDRSGAAVTAAETPRLKPFIPSVTDDPDVVKKKLTRFRDEYKAIQEDLMSVYSRDQGYQVDGKKPPAAGAKPTLGQIFGE